MNSAEIASKLTQEADSTPDSVLSRTGAEQRHHERERRRRLAQRARKLGLGALLVLALVGTGLALRPRPVPVDASVARSLPLSVVIEESGVTRVKDRFVVSAPVAGSISRLAFEPGDEVREGDALAGVDPPSIDSALTRTWQNMETFQAFAASVRPEAGALIDQLAALQQNLDAFAQLPSVALSVAELRASARAVVDTGLGGDAGLAHAALTLSSARAAVAQLRATLDRLDPQLAALTAAVRASGARLSQLDALARPSSVLASVRAAADRLDPLLASAAALQAMVERGDGTIGRLMNDPEFPEDAKDLGKILKRHPWRIIGHPAD